MLSLILKFFKRKPKCGVDRAIDLQHPDDAATTNTPCRSEPAVVHFDSRNSAIEMGYWMQHPPRRLRKCNVDMETLLEPGSLRRLNRLIRRGYYRSTKHKINANQIY